VSIRLRIGTRLRVEAGTEIREFTDLQQALLLLLADSGASGMSRDRIAELLWDAASGATSPRRRLRQLVYGTNRRAGFSIVDGDAGALRLGPDTLPIWTGEDAGAELAPPTKAFQVARQELADRAWHRSREDVLSSVDRARLADDPDRILDLLSADANPGSLWRDGVWALFRSGRVREAEAVFADLGVTDSDTLERCRAALGRLASGDAPSPESDRIDLPLVGRGEVIAEAVRALRAEDRRVVLTGPSGVGLTRTLGSVTAWILSELDDLVIASATCSYSGKSIAYDTLNRLFDSELFRAAHLEVEEPWRSVIARVLRVYGRAPEVEMEPLEGTAASLRVLHGISHLIMKAIGNAQLVAVVDDLHLADPASLTVLTHLGVDGDGAVIRLLGAIRTDTPLDGPTRNLIEREATVIDVVPLGPDTSRELLVALRPDLGDEVIDTVVTLADGYPRRLLEASRSIEADSGSLRGATLEELLRIRLEGLSPDEQEILGLLSVAPDGLPAELVMTATDLGLLDLGRGLATLEARGVVASDGNLRIRSSFLREQIRAGLPDSIQAALHRSIAKSLMRVEPVPASSIGRHLSDAGDHEDAMDWLVRGARDAAEAEAFSVAIELLDRALESVGPEALGWQVLDFAGGLCIAEGRFEAGARYFGAAVTTGEGVGADERELLGVRLREVRALSECRFGDGRPLDQAWALLENARALGDLDAEARALDVLFRIADFNLDFDLTWAALDELKKARARDEVSPYLDWVEVRRSYIDDPEAAREAAIRFYEFSEEGSADRLMALARLVGAACLVGSAADKDVSAAVVELSATHGGVNPFFQCQAISNVANWLLERGLVEQARSALLEGLETGRRMGGSLHGILLGNLAEVSLRMGCLDQARDALAEARDIAERSPRSRFELDSALALVELECGRVSRASTRIAAWRSIPFDRPIPYHPDVAIEARVRVLCALGDRVEATRELDQAIERTTRLSMESGTERTCRLRKQLRLTGSDG
jgi:tetratricopeptide (TPR) repeat protein